MIINQFYLGLKREDYSGIGGIVSDFNFLTDYITHFIEMRIKKEKFETKNPSYKMLLIRGCKTPKKEIILENKCLILEVFFDEEKYRTFYPKNNNYPIKDIIIPVQNNEGFNNFLLSMIIEGLDKAKFQILIPYDLFINIIIDFKKEGCKNEWVYKRKIIKGLAVVLLCKLTPNEFILTLNIEKDNKKIFNKEILKTIPSTSMYKDEFKDIELVDNNLRISKRFDEQPLFEIALSKF